MSDLASSIEATLAASGTPLTVSELATSLGIESHEIDRCIWREPRRFSWQPGNRWALTPSKRGPISLDSEFEDQGENSLSAEPGESLSGRTLGSGTELKVSQKPMDTGAVFVVRSVGNEIRLILNSNHEVFDTHPIPFAEDSNGMGDYKSLVEDLLIAWAMYVDGEAQSDQRRIEETAFLWGRRISEVLRDRGSSI